MLPEGCLRRQDVTQNMTKGPGRAREAPRLPWLLWAGSDQQ